MISDFFKGSKKRVAGIISFILFCVFSIIFFVYCLVVKNIEYAFKTMELIGVFCGALLGLAGALDSFSQKLRGNNNV